jgi:hypothetical protein
MSHPAFDVTFVDVRLPNKQKRQHRIVRAISQPRARETFNQSVTNDGLQVNFYKIISVDEVIAEPSAQSLAALVTVFNGRQKPARHKQAA